MSNENTNDLEIVDTKAINVSIGKIDETTPVYTSGTRLVKKERPFTTKDTPVEKLYLVLKVYVPREDNVEEYRSFEFYKGTSQELYDHIKREIETHDELDIMRSRVLVDSPTVTISRKCTIYMFMRDMRSSKRIIDDTSFDIEDYAYDEGDCDVEG